MLIGLKIKELRLGKSWSMQKLGNLLGVTRAQIQKYESGKNEPPLEKIYKLAEIFEVNAAELVGDISLLKVDNSATEVAPVKFDADFIKELVIKHIRLLEDVQSKTKKEADRLQEIIDLKNEISRLKNEA